MGFAKRGVWLTIHKDIKKYGGVCEQTNPVRSFFPYVQQKPCEYAATDYYLCIRNMKLQITHQMIKRTCNICILSIEDLMIGGQIGSHNKRL